MELKGNRPVQHSSTCQSGTQRGVLSICGRGSSLVSQVPCLGYAIVVVGDKKKFCFNFMIMLELLLVTGGLQTGDEVIKSFLFALSVALDLPCDGFV